MKTRRVLLAGSIAGLIAGVALSPGCSSDKGTNPPPGPNPTFNSGDLTVPGQAFVVTFPDPGSFGYRCVHHGGMTGTVNVTAAAADSPQHVQVGPGGTNTFNPSAISVKPNGYVTWVYSGTGTAHTVTRP